MDYKDLNDYELIYQVRENDDIAYNTLILKYSNLVNMLAKKYLRLNKGLGLEREDLFQAGMLGVTQAMDDYKSDDTMFYTYASLCAKREIERLLKASTRHKNRALNEALSFDKKITKERGNVLTLGETISSNFDIEEDYITRENYRRLQEFKYDLSLLESSILELKLNGFRIKEIGNLLDVPYRTVDYHLNRIKKKAKDVLI